MTKQLPPTAPPALPRHSHNMLVALGITGGRLPLEGLAARYINGVLVWVAPASPYAPRNGKKSSVHRVLCECPVCKVHLSAGRLHQHVCDPARVADLARLNAEADAVAELDRADAGVRAAVAAGSHLSAFERQAISEGLQFRAARLASETTAEPVPCVFCGKLHPGVYGQPGTAMLRADNQTLVCGDCGTREALEGGLRMTVSHFLDTFTGSHEIYESDPMARKFLALTGERAPWTPRSAHGIRQEIKARGLGGSYESTAPGIAGYEMAEACAWDMVRFNSVKNGRGAIWRECIEALRGNGR